MSTVTPLALQLPLCGSQLIEASAGTGKTWTISALYLRLVLGQGCERPLLPPEILVVTFTDAATRELRDRIRARLVEAARAFRGELAGDALLQQLMATFEATQWPACARRLDIAAQWMDEAAVSTIHSWCQRMLREHAFDSCSLFTQSLETDHSELLGEVVRDYWRLHCYPLQLQALHWVDRSWKTPGHLLEKLRPLLGEDAECSGSLAGVIEPALAQQAAELAALKADWPQWCDELQQLLDQAVAARLVNGRQIQARYYQPWLDKLRHWAADEQATALELGTGFTRLTPEGLAEAWKKGSPPQHPALDAMCHLPARLAAMDGPHEPALRHAAAWVRQRFALEKRRRAELGFDDMLLNLDAALQGDNGERLAEVIRRQFPLALIDEFQDTDPVQYRIFDRIYQVEANRADCGLLLIGDPKQAIYAFRGADIHTYLRARRATRGRHWSLDTNYRSSRTMVAAVNRAFQLAEQHPQGAFLFRSAEDNPLPFNPVQARGRTERWQVEGEDAPALSLWQLASEQPLSSGAYREQMAERAATEITRLLALGQQGQAGFAGEQGLQALQPADVAVLVRGGGEAQAIRQALAARGVRSVYLSDRDSVFQSAEAQDLLHWLQACAEPDNERALRAALATGTLGLALIELEQLNQDERRWEQRVMQFRSYRQRWQRQGVLPALHRLLHDFALPQRLMRRDDGERVLTNLLHLAELLQQAAAELDGEQALLRHYRELLAGSGEVADEQILRLESDAALVRVVTIHKSKGLEYPLVFLPFVCNFRAADRKKPHWLRSQGERRLFLQISDEQLEMIERERLAEDLRLLYVALTRARHACWLGMADIRHGNGKQSELEQSAIGYLLGGGAPLDSSAALAQWLQPWVMAAECTLLPAPEPDDRLLAQLAGGQVLPSWRERQRARGFEPWWIASYSALRLGETPAARFGDSAPDIPAAEKVADDDPQPLSQPLRRGELPSLHRFPRGPQPGTFLHGLLELVGEEGFAAAQQRPQWLRDQLARRCQLRGLTGWIDTLQGWLQQLLVSALPLQDAPALQLCRLQRYQVELEFWFEACRVDVQAIDRLVQASELAGLRRPALQADRLNGMFKGFIDLAFEHAGRWYVADWKSNWLGEDDSAYSQEAMAQAMAGHRYDLQYCLYLLALHRQLRLRLGEAYDYDQHVGGAVYVFLRGGDAPGQGVFHARPPRALIEGLDALFRGAAVEEVADAG